MTVRAGARKEVVGENVFNKFSKAKNTFMKEYVPGFEDWARTEVETLYVKSSDKHISVIEAIKLYRECSNELDLPILKFIEKKRKKYADYWKYYSDAFDVLKTEGTMQIGEITTIIIREKESDEAYLSADSILRYVSMTIISEEDEK